MRPYRAIPIDKAIDSGEFVYGWYVVIDGRCCIVEKDCGSSTYRLEAAVAYDNFMEVHPTTVGQQVGLSDKNGKQEAYAGDEIKTLVRGKWCIDTIHWSKYGWFPWACDDDYTGKEFEIIGNIHTKE